MNLGTGTLGGTGTIIAPTVTAGGLVVPGNSPGTLSITGDFTFLATSIFQVELGGTTQGTDYDFLNVTGSAVLGGTLSLAFLNGFQSAVQPADSFTVLNAASLSGAFANAASGARLTTTDGLGSFLVNYNGLAVTLSGFQAVPEPSTWTLLGLGGLAMLAQRARRRRRD